MSMYNLTRQEAADQLGISTRSVDRYIKSGKLRAEKRGKVVYVSNDDINNMSSGGNNRQEVIMPGSSSNSDSQAVSRQNESITTALDTVYSDLKEEIKQKDETIQALSMRVGRAEEVAKNSVSLIDFKKSQFLLEESKSHLGKEVEGLEEKHNELQKELKHEKTTNIILIVFVLLLLVIAGVIWFVKI